MRRRLTRRKMTVLSDFTLYFVNTQYSVLILSQGETPGPCIDTCGQRVLTLHVASARPPE